MEELIKLIVGLIKGQFELKEYTRLNEEVDDDTVEVSFRFDVIQKFPLRKWEYALKPWQTYVRLNERL